MVSGTGPGVEWSPLIHLQLQPPQQAASAGSGKKGVSAADRAPPPLSEAEAQQQTLTLRRLADVAFSKYGVLLSVPTYSCLDRRRPTPSVRLMVPVALTDKEVAAVVAAVKGAAKEALVG